MSKLRNRDDAINQANYRIALEDDGNKRCEDCIWRQKSNAQTNWCERWKFFYDNGFFVVCDTHLLFADFTSDIVQSLLDELPKEVLSSRQFKALSTLNINQELLGM